MNGVPTTAAERVPVVRSDGLTKVFCDFWRRPRVTAVADLSLSIDAGEIFGLLGPNGSGKSTTIKMLLGLLHPSAGGAAIFGRAPSDLGVRRRIGYLPEDAHLYRFLTARETLDFYGRLFGLPAAARVRRREQLLEMVGLAQAANRPVGEFSKGMARRIGLAQALINDPDLVILDEPTAGLDPVGCRQVKDLLLALARRGKTVLISSHLLADIEDVCGRVAILFNGRLCACGRIGDVLQSREEIRLTLPTLSPEQQAALTAWLRAHVGANPRIEHPAVSLEEFFLRVVRAAGGAEGAAGRAGADAALAPFLRESPADAARPAGTAGV